MLLDLERGLIEEFPQLMQLQHNKNMSCLQCIHMKPESNLGTDYLGQVAVSLV